MLKHLRDEGIDIREGAFVDSVSGSDGKVAVKVKVGDAFEVIEGTHLLVAAGRRPNIADLGLEAAGIKFEKKGITVDAGLRTSNKRVFAIGDVAGGLQFTHVANDHAGIVIRRVAVPPAGQSDGARRSLGDVYRSRTRARRSDRGRGARGARKD